MEVKISLKQTCNCPPNFLMSCKVNKIKRAENFSFISMSSLACIMGFGSQIWHLGNLTGSLKILCREESQLVYVVSIGSFAVLCW